MGKVVCLRSPAVGGGSRVGADGNSAADNEATSIGCRQQNALYAGLGNGGLLLDAITRAAFNRAAVALASVLQAHHAIEELGKRARAAGILCTASSPQGYASRMGDVDGGKVSAAGNFAFGILTGVVFRVGHICVYMAGAVSTLTPVLEAGGLVALHLEFLVAAITPLADVGVFLEHPAQMLAGADIAQVVDVLDVENLMAAILLFLGGDLQTPELGQVREVIAAGSGCS